MDPEDEITALDLLLAIAGQDAMCAPDDTVVCDPCNVIFAVREWFGEHPEALV